MPNLNTVNQLVLESTYILRGLLRDDLHIDPQMHSEKLKLDQITNGIIFLQEIFLKTATLKILL